MATVGAGAQARLSDRAAGGARRAACIGRRSVYAAHAARSLEESDAGLAGAPPAREQAPTTAATSQRSDRRHIQAAAALSPFRDDIVTI
jgi:hypothetical protein